MRIAITAALLGACALPALADTPEGIHFAHHDWEIACDNTRTCRAVGYYQAEEPGNPAATVLLERAAGPGRPVTATLMLTGFDGKYWVPKTGNVAMRADGHALGDVTLGGDDMQGTLSAAQLRALVEAVAGTGVVQWHDGEQVWTLSGQGAAAVLLKMDALQGRLGTPGALLRMGSRAEDGVLPALPPPEVRRAATGKDEVVLPPATRAALMRELRGTLAEGDCEALGPDDLSALPLSAGRLLVYGQCWAGAAGTGTAYWVTGSAAPFEPALVTTDGSDHAPGEIHAYRSMSGCWESTEWVWDGRRFARTRQATSGRCGTAGFGSTWNLPTFVAKVMPRPR
ncbi:DUF1176 domain-containing protein [Pseudoduganella albidiflava]|uniref:DUF1176 domain-containing protein n=1 Tax=Pseudoduganella albidiflava TaxID=321983 RepID=A0A411WYS6_9BURK|nr:DUF1176 domain-containing protein [Pseudoduganella albidiflava]QBI01851.1 DUF1176 domain-containing protein [Pseudoduganella albidiflava]GGY39185.1 hypothetical protein GCM10007387_21500 [Pseudoduganella albidiflava]